MRRAEAYAVRFGAGTKETAALTKIAEFCRVARLSQLDLQQITGGRSLVGLLPNLPNTRRRWAEPDSDWEAEYAIRQARGVKRQHLARLFLNHYDWLNRDLRISATYWDILRAASPHLSQHIRMAPYLNGESSHQAFEAYIATLYDQNRTADIAFLLTYGAPSSRLAFHRALAYGDVGLAGRELSAPIRAGDEAEDAYRQLMDLRAKALAHHPPSPRPARRGHRPRFALCVSGQLRSWSIAIPPLIEQLKAAGEIDVFVSTWRRPATFTRRFAQRQFSPPAREFMLRLPDPFDEHLFRILPQLRQEPLELLRLLRQTLGTDHVDMEDEADFEERLPTLLPGYEPAALNQYKMYYKIYAAWRMQRNYAKACGIEYDYVIRIRPDYLIESLPIAEIQDRVDDDAVVAGSYAYGDGFDDRFAIGSPSAMARHAEVWLRMVEAGSHRYLPPPMDSLAREPSLAEELMIAHLFARGCRPIVLRDVRTVSANELQVQVSDEAMLRMLDECAIESPLNPEQVQLRMLLGGGRSPCRTSGDDVSAGGPLGHSECHSQNASAKT